MKDLICVAQRGRSYRGEPQHFEESPNPGKTNCLTTVAKDNLIMQRPRGKNKGAINTEKSPTLSANSWQQNNLSLIPQHFDLTLFISSCAIEIAIEIACGF